MRTVCALALLAAAIHCGAPVARGDVGVERVYPSAAEPGDAIEVELYCGGCPAGGLSFPISLVPADEAPGLRSCRRGALCRKSAFDVPRHPPFRFLGRTDRSLRPRLRAEVPRVPPGAYELVIFCPGCYPGPRGSLISTDGRPDAALRVEGPTRSAAASKDGTDALWLILGIAAVIAGASAWARRVAKR